MDTVEIGSIFYFQFHKPTLVMHLRWGGTLFGNMTVKNFDNLSTFNSSCDYKSSVSFFETQCRMKELGHFYC